MFAISQISDAPRLPRGERQTDTRAISIIPLGQALSAFFIVSYTICILGHLFFPDFKVQHESVAIFLPGFTLLSWHPFFLGLIESFIWSWHVAVVFGSNLQLRPAPRGSGT
jgi:hypothetical protein